MTAIPPVPATPLVRPKRTSLMQEMVIAAAESPRPPKQAAVIHLTPEIVELTKPMWPRNKDETVEHVERMAEQLMPTVEQLAADAPTANEIVPAGAKFWLERDAATVVDDPDNLHITVPRRFMREGRWKAIARVRDEMMKAAIAKHMPKADARAWCYAELDRLYPPLPTPKAPNSTPENNDVDAGVSSESMDGGTAIGDATGDQSTRARGQIEPIGTDRVTPCQPSSHENAGLRGLGDIPDGWPDLPDNASLASEIAWVQANRLRVVEDRGPVTMVHLAKARTPAPSWSALGWLETSIRSYAKFVDVAAKVSGGDSDEGEQVRRERMAIEDIRSLLAEMHAD